MPAKAVSLFRIRKAADSRYWFMIAALKNTVGECSECRTEKTTSLVCLTLMHARTHAHRKERD